ncbi:MAG: diguanylate cyclase [Betaproteobacteria bacterium]|nr:diguanylate cyclase [Betaproteobacteria bacterium]
MLNRRGFDQAMNEVLTQRAPVGLTHCLTILDIDHFKRVNDTHGHPIGDAVIESIGQVLCHVARGPMCLPSALAARNSPC